MKSKKQILVIDDVSTNLRFVAEVLKDTYSVSLAKSGDQAFKIMEKIVPDLILLDVKMPEMDGFEVFEKILADENKKDIPVVFLTADSLEEYEEKCTSMGAKGYFRKPLSYDPFVKFIDDIFSSEE